MNPLERYAALLRSLPDKTVPNPKQPVLISLSEHLGAPTGLSVDASTLLQWAGSQNLLGASTLWRIREIFEKWELQKPMRSEIADFIDTLVTTVKPVGKPSL